MLEYSKDVGSLAGGSIAKIWIFPINEHRCIFIGMCLLQRILLIIERVDMEVLEEGYRRGM